MPRYLAFLTDLIDPAGQVMFMLTGEEFSLGLIISKFDFLHLKSTYWLIFIH